MFFFLMLAAGGAGIAVAAQSLLGALALWAIAVLFLLCDWKLH
ncbi:MAG: hypothetical protein WBA76_10395 [Phormidesmis sp.]